MANTVFKLFSDPELAQEALAALRSSGYPAEAIGVLMRKDRAEAGVAELAEQTAVVGTLPDVGPVAAAGAEVFGLAAGAADADVSASLGAALGLTPEAVGAFAIDLLRGGVLVAVRPQAGLPDAKGILRRTEPANVRIAKQRNEGFEIAERRTSTVPTDGQFSGDFRKY